MIGDQSSHGLWEASAPAGPATSPLSGAIRADVVIVGAGYTGCSAALHLALAGARPVILDAAEIGFGGAGRNVGLVNAGLWVMPDTVLEAMGEDRGERLVRQLGEGPGLVFDLIARHDIACEAVRAGTLHCAAGRHGAADLAERARQWRRRGAPVELLKGREAARLTGSDAFPAVLLDHRAGTIQPLAYARGLAAAAIRHGAEIHTRSPALAFEDLDDRWRITTPGGSVTAPRVIVATDAYSTGPWRTLAREQVPLPYFNLATAPLPLDLRAVILPERQGAWDTKSILSSFRLDAAGRLVFGSVGALRSGGTRVHARWARRELARLFPALGRIEFDFAWYGTIGMTDDALPRLHALHRNIVSISGYNGRGIAPGTSFGRDLARIALGEVGLDELALPQTAVRAAPFRALKGAFYEAGAQIAHAIATRF
ncbi:FAD-binding oxidoreductase [Sphingosinicella sp. CPCC 101087]|uniref:NAD(P)/FAD-dependent oxidoreductase n=1 Tax=Sphingosinicella sp. CPCC 101087 TaxID=2497754 RepID=UPI00101D43F1|nr:FAD-binding oxidoreductase [Sphingosinicella sp. CPCC 101087]